MTSRRFAALAWLAFVVVAGGYLAWRIGHGLPIETDLMALLPRESRDSVAQEARDAVSRALSRRVLVLVGHGARAEARAAAARMSARLDATGLFEPEAGSGAEGLRKLGQLYFPARAGLLSKSDREALNAGRGQDLATRALAQAFSVGGTGEGLIARGDPFLLLPSFLTHLPSPMPRVAWDDGVLSVTEGGKTWVLLVRTLAREPFALDVQNTLTTAYAEATQTMKTAHLGVEIRRTGVVFFAAAGARSAITEAATLSLLSLGGTLLLFLAIFRRFGPLLHNMLAILVGVGVGLAGTLILFGEVHVAVLLFGTSLIGVVDDYCLHYNGTEFDPEAGSPDERLRSILPSITLGMLTTVLGYLVLAFAPLDGLRQIAVFSALGIAAAFVTVILWLPALDQGARGRRADRMLSAAGQLFRFWEENRWRWPRRVALCLGVVVALVGFARIETNDDIRRMQALSPELLADQNAILAVTGTRAASEFLLVEGADDEAALRRQEAIAPILGDLQARGAFSGFFSPADFVPSASRQQENRALVIKTLDPLLPRHYAALGLRERPAEVSGDVAPLTLDGAMGSGALTFLRDLVVAPGLHVVMPQGLLRPDLVRETFRDVPGVRLVEPAAELSALFGVYRQRALALIAFSACLMFIAFAFRYGAIGAAWVMLPSVAAVVLTPAVLALMGAEFNFFHTMALVLILAVGVDYGVFCAESPKAHRATAMFSIGLAMLTTLFSFGLLSLSHAPAIESFGSSMAIGLTLAFVLAPLASRCRTSVVNVPQKERMNRSHEAVVERPQPWAAE